MSMPLEKICIVCRREFPKDIQECPDDLVRLSDKDPRIGTVFDGKYEILDFLGAGGLSRVYKARHKELNRILALKILKSYQLIDLQRFRREAISIGQLEHPNIARVYSFGASPEGVPYMAMEYLDGRDLANWTMREGPLNIKQAVNVFEQIAAALEHAHAKKIVHRDIKPSNIILLSSPNQINNVKVVDFGMAKLLGESDEDEQRITQQGEIFGTKQYVSPEQYKGAEADERADIFALGITMYESVVRDGKLPERLKPIISKATESDPAARFQTATELREGLSIVRDSITATDSDLSGVLQENKSRTDFFGTFYFWTVIGSMILLSIVAAIVIKQKLNSLEKNSIQLHGSNVRSPARVMKPLSFAATHTQAVQLQEDGQMAAAVELYTQWLERNKNSNNAEEMIQAEKYIAALEDYLGNIDSAVKHINAGFKLARSKGLTSGPTYCDLLNTFAELQRECGDYALSINTSKTIIDLTKEPGSKQELDCRVNAFLDIAKAKLAEGKLDEAEAWVKKDLEICGSKFDEGDTAVAEAHETWAGICSDRKNYLGALEHINLCLENYGTRRRYEGPMLHLLAYKSRLLMKMNNKPEAEKCFNMMLDRYKQLSVANGAVKREAYVSLNQLARFLGKDLQL